VLNKGNNRYPCWEATSEPVYLNNGDYVVHDRHVTVGRNGTRLTKKSSLVGFALAEYSNGDHADPVSLLFPTECHDRSLQRHARQTVAPSMPAPTHTKKRPHAATARQELLSPTPRSSRRRTSGLGHST
jgi:hypothetical protein